LKILDPLDYESKVWSDDDEIYAYSLTESNPNWVDVPEFPILLSKSDKSLIIKRIKGVHQWLNDRIISGMIRKLKIEFPHLNGLQDPLLCGLFLVDSKTGQLNKGNKT
jgi:hypothetical protein